VGDAGVDLRPVMPNSTTLRISTPTGVPRKPSTGMVKRGVFGGGDFVHAQGGF
jgi:hypothetical protein